MTPQDLSSAPVPETPTPRMRLRAKGQITIPASVRWEAGIEEGDCLDFIVRGKGVVVILADGQHQEAELPPEMLERIDRSLAELGAGLARIYLTDDDFLASLDIRAKHSPSAERTP